MTDEMEMIRSQASAAQDRVEYGWLALERDPAFVVLHEPSGPKRDTAVLMCPPFGWEEAMSYRAWRAWAEAFAQDGYPVARLAVPSTGDSGGVPSDDDRLEAWTDAVAEATKWLQAHTGCPRIAVMAIGLGGLVASRAIAMGAVVDDLVLWAVPGTGRRLLRELKTYSAIVAAQEKYDIPASNGHAENDGRLELTGYALSAETAAALQSLKLSELPWPDGAQRRVLMLERDGLAVDAALSEHFERAGSKVTTMPTDDFAAMMSSPQLTQLPQATATATLEWLGRPRRAESGPSTNGTPRAPGTAWRSGEVELHANGQRLHESVLKFEIEVGQGFGILTEAVDRDPEPLWGVLLNAGALSHTGPNRMWVETARRWAARGISTVRVDLEAIGEADGDARQHMSNKGLYEPKMITETMSLLDQLEERGSPGRYLVGGTCSGAYWSLHTALADQRVLGALLINLFAFSWSEELDHERSDRVYNRAMREAARRRLTELDLSWRHIRTAVRALRGGTFSPRRRTGAESAQLSLIDDALDRLQEKGTETLLVLSEGEPLREQLERLVGSPRWPNLVVKTLPSSDHLYRAMALQQQVNDALDQLSGRVLERLPRTARRVPEPHRPSATL